MIIKFSSLKDWYDYQCKTHPDLSEHIPTLFSLVASSGYSIVGELGTRTGGSLSALLLGTKRKAYTLDLKKPSWLSSISLLSLKENKELIFLQGDSRVLTFPEELELLFIDTLHTEEQLNAELEKHSSNVKHTIVLHDTETFGEYGEKPGTRGLKYALTSFLLKNKNWTIGQHFSNQHGLTILNRND